MGFKMNGPTFYKNTPLKQTYITDEMRTEKNAAELAFNKKMHEEGFTSDTNLKGSSAELLALKGRFDKSREGFIQKNTEDYDREVTEIKPKKKK
jgi:hypothetical protein